MTSPGLLIYDADCGFCTTSARWYAEKAGNASAIAPWQGVDLAAHRLTEEQASVAVQWSNDGHTTSGASAIADALRSTTGPWRVVGRVLGTPPVSWIARALYPVIARNRHRLPGATEACRLPNAR